jgi:hypothetical protein
MKLALLFSGLFIFSVALGQDINYSAAAIPDSLKKDAEAVYRLDEGNLTVISSSEYILKVRQVVTLLNANAASYLHHRLGTDKFHKVEDVEVTLYDALGRATKKYGRKDFETTAAFDGFSLVTDDKVMSLYTPAPGYPCTVDVQYRIHATGYIDLPNWYINSHKTATEVFRYKVLVPESMDIRHRTLHLSAVPRTETIGTVKHYAWEAAGIKARRLEDESFEPAYYLPQIEVAPNEFSYDGYKGSFRNWADFGIWAYKLYEEKAPFPEHRAKQIKAMVAEAATLQEKISILYRHLQQTMRYVSIQLGIGGFKPFAVQFVDEKKYGDCKALTNYMRYMLQTVGITAYPALINAGHNKIPADASFATNPFNHVILCIPGNKDTTWLECTSTTGSAGHLGTFTENKKALLLTERGGILVNTPASDYRNNLVVTRNLVTVAADGSATIENNLLSQGEAASFFQYVGQLHEEEQKEKLVQMLHFKNPEELTLTKREKEQAAFVVNRSYEKLYIFKTANKYFFPVCINQLAVENLKPFLRETTFLFPYPYLKRDTTVFQFPAGFNLTAVPDEKELTTAYATYKRSCRYNKEANQLTTINTLTLQQHAIPARAYMGLVQFFKEVAALEEENFVLEKQQGVGF